jgi:hypothetical protein
VPRRPSLTTNPRSRSSRYAAAAVPGFTPRSAASARTVGSRSPGATAPCSGETRASTGFWITTDALIPVVAIVLGWALLGEAPPVVAAAGGALCLAGVAIARRR